MSHSNEASPEWLQDLLDLNVEDAMARLHTIAEAHPEDPRPHLLLGGMHAQAKHLDLAEAAYITALQRAPGLDIARFQLGLLQLTTARVSVAVATWGPLDRLPVEHPLRLFKQGMVCLTQDRFLEALPLLREGILQNQGNPPLNVDMQRLIDLLDPPASAPEPDPAAEQASPMAEAGREEQPAAPEVEGHFLLSAYRNQP